MIGSQIFGESLKLKIVKVLRDLKRFVFLEKIWDLYNGSGVWWTIMQSLKPCSQRPMTDKKRLIMQGKII